MESVGFKEWAIVCEALGRGAQCVILRKGGIAEGRAGFTFEHREFFLFPTFFHEQVQKTRSTVAKIPHQQAGEIEIGYFVQLEFSTVISSWEMALALEPFHILQPDVVRERFDYDKAPGIHVGFVRVFRLKPRWILQDSPRYGGCRSWVKLPSPPVEQEMEPVVHDAVHQAQRNAVRALLGTPVSPVH